MEIQFVDESEYQNEGKWYFYIENSQLELRADVSENIFPFPSKTKNNFRGIDISQPTPLMSLSVPLFSLGKTYCVGKCKKKKKAIENLIIEALEVSHLLGNDD